MEAFLSQGGASLALGYIMLPLRGNFFYSPTIEILLYNGYIVKNMLSYGA